MMEAVIQLGSAFLGAMGYCLLFHLRPQLLLPATLGSILNWGIYLLLEPRLNSVFYACLIASAAAALYAEAMAKRLRAPATLFLVPSIMPSIPGGSLFYAMSSAVRGQWTEARAYGFRTAEYALAIAAGISLVWALYGMVQQVIRAVRQKRQSRH
ncbi:MAG: threonine/serine exporter family protein [Candidatus Onthomonas sp.]